MSSMFSWFKSNAEVGDCEIPEIFRLSLQLDKFILSDIHNTYLKILTDAMERTHGLSKQFEPLLWDSCVQSEATEGLLTHLAHAMTRRQSLFLVYAPSVKVLRKATPEEEKQILADYEKSGESKVGVYVSFAKYRRTEMLEIYSSFEYCVLSSLNKTLNLSKAVQVKISDLRTSVSLADSAIAKEQAKSIARALGKGNDILLDVKDMIMTATPDTSATEKAIAFLDAKRAFILHLPLAYISGEQTGGIGSTGEADMRAIERGLKQYFVSILRPVILALFGEDTEFKSQDFRQMTTALEVLKTFDLVSDENLSRESKQEIVARVFDLDLKQEQKNIEEEAKQAALDAKNNPQVTPQPTNGNQPGNNGGGTNPPPPKGSF